ncbi:MAG: hypothetical protein RLZZ244_2510 [Verrucomicrobiota bacterium]|jgi:putative FmdB family regulatory protein
MPAYDFDCGLCGEFVASLPISRRDEPVECPGCGGRAVRMVSAPNLALMNPTVRKAIGVNEKSRHAPKVSSAHSCGSGCGCGTKIRKGRTQKTRMGLAQAAKPGARPWMLGH